MKNFLLSAILFVSAPNFAQQVLKENLSPKETLFWDYNKTQIQSSGFYFKDAIETTHQKHGKWTYYDRFGQLEEERNYYKDILHGKVLLYYPNKKLKQEGYFNLGRQDSIYKEYFENGKLSMEGHYKLNEPVGIWTYYYLDGRKKSVEELKGGQSYILSFWLPDSLNTQTIVDGNGEMATYHTTGTVKEWYNFKDGLKDGPFEEISSYGYTTVKGYFKLGEKDSTWTYSYYTGDKEKISNYKKGKLDGLYMYFYDNGKVNVSGNYQEGKKTGRWIWYTNTGTKDMEGEFKEDLQDGAWIYYYPTGELSYEAHYDNGLKTGHWVYYYKDGTKFKEGDFKDDQKDGKWETWYENGELLMTGEYKNGKEEGEWKNFWENGTLKNKSTFKKGELNGSWTSVYPNGTAKLTGTYENGFQVGEWIEYFENGKTKDVITYKLLREKSKIDYGIMKDRERWKSIKDGPSVSYSSKDFGKTEEGVFKDGMKEGVWTAYHPGGKIPAVVSSYKKGELDGNMKQYDRRGNLLQEIEYKNGLKHGRFIIYDNEQKKRVEKSFDMGIEISKDK